LPSGTLLSDELTEREAIPIEIFDLELSETTSPRRIWR
jgi:hypothetical protein